MVCISHIDQLQHLTITSYYSQLADAYNVQQIYTEVPTSKDPENWQRFEMPRVFRIPQRYKFVG